MQGNELKPQAKALAETAKDKTIDKVFDKLAASLVMIAEHSPVINPTIAANVLLDRKRKNCDARDLILEATTFVGEALKKLVALLPESEIAAINQAQAHRLAENATFPEIKALNPDLSVTHIKEQPGLASRANCALIILIHGANNCGYNTRQTVSYPHSLDSFDIDREAFNLLKDVFSALLEVLPAQDLEQLLKDQRERLSFAFGD